MLFFEAEGMLLDPGEESPDRRRTMREIIRRICVKTEEFNQKKGKNAFCFVSGNSDGVLNAAMITQDAQGALAHMQAFLRYIDQPVQDMTFSETTISGIRHLLGRADRNDYIDDAERILEKFHLDTVLHSRSRGVDYGENLLEEANKKTVIQEAERYLMQETLLPELERIYAGASQKGVAGHPVHYLIQTDNADTRREVSRLLLQALYANGRLHSRRYCFLNIRPGQEFSAMTYRGLYHVCAGGAVIVRYLAGDDSQEDDAASGEGEIIEQLCQVAKLFRNQVLTVFCLPRECNQTRARFYDNLDTMTMVELQESLCDHDRSREFLKSLARQRHIRTDRALLGKLEVGEGYLPSQLHAMFDSWYNEKLKRAVYPQYKQLQVVTQKAVKNAPKGNAYEELQQMVGLTEAKAVIRKALNYYKMQKLYEQRGIKADTPAMHMVFTGNPGTAKTTAARLFARIMKDNGLLPKGQLVEVGRGDLVGKYVGWTAQTVQSKFKAAKGGVLFIDEAYSLVDDRSGSYGDEAINTIVQEMENHREDVVVIFAGYPDKMEGFLQKNPGLRSRIAFHIPFADYDAGELCQIAQLMGKNKGLQFEPAAMEKLGAAFESARKHQDFGNGRFVRNLLEQAKMNQASRLLEYDFDAITTQEIKTIRAEDITVPEEKAEEVRRIGFAC